jgi:iron complex transport system substrate-binding protein
MKCTISAALILLAGICAGAAAADTCGPQRIVSLSPSITETLFALGLGGRVAGVTRYCRYPPEAERLPKVGGYADPDYEGIVRLKPDLVIMMREHESAAACLRKLQVPVLTVDHNSVAGIINSIGAIGDRCHAAQRAGVVADSLKEQIGRIRKMTERLLCPRVMVCVEHGAGAFTGLYIAGKNTFYDELVALAGGQNAYVGADVMFPLIAIEGIYRINPQVIFDMLPAIGGKPPDTERVAREWKTLAKVDAVKNGRVYVFDQDYAVVPGPRFIATLEQMARAIHPELAWK